MKKFLSIALALVLVFCMTVSVYAEDNYGPRSEGEVVKVSVTNGAVSNYDIVYKVDIAWDSLTFSYNRETGDAEWNPENHQYEESTNAQGNLVSSGWDKTQANIVVKNHSNAEVAVSAKFDNDATEATVNGVTATVSAGGFDGTLDSAVGTTVPNAPSVTYTVGVAGVPEADDEFDVGTITVSINAVNP